MSEDPAFSADARFSGRYVIENAFNTRLEFGCLGEQITVSIPTRYAQLLLDNMDRKSSRHVKITITVEE